MMDMDTLNQRFGDNPEHLREALGLFKAECEKLLGTLDHALQQGNYTTLRTLAHDFKVMCHNMTARPMGEHALALEHASLRQEHAQVETHLAHLKSMFQQTLDYCETQKSLQPPEANP